VGRFAIVELHKDELKFSAGHFMLLSPTSRESMHGHDYQIHVAFHTLIEENGMSFDCRLYKQRLLQICQMLDYRFILPAHSNYLRVREEKDHWIAEFNHEVMSFLKQDAVVLPISNVTLEELSDWFLREITADLRELQAHRIHGVTVKVYNGRGESGSTLWGKMTA